VRETRAVDVLEHILAMRGMRLEGGDAVTITVDGPKSVAATFGAGDGRWENIVSVDGIEDTPLGEMVRDLAVRYEPDYKEGKLSKALTRTANPKGTDRQVELPLVYSPATADRVLDYRRKRLQGAARTLRITVGTDGDGVRKGDRVKVVVPSLGLDGALAEWEVVEAGRSLGRHTLTLIRYVEAAYTYEAGSGAPSDPGDIPPDTSLTDPDPVSNLSFNAATRVLTWTLPQDIATRAEVYFRENGDTVWQVAGEAVDTFTFSEATLVAGWLVRRRPRWWRRPAPPASAPGCPCRRHLADCRCRLWSQFASPRLRRASLPPRMTRCASPQPEMPLRNQRPVPLQGSTSLPS